MHSNDEDGDNPYDTNFGTTHGIQMNPLSPHPPRTPRTSMAYSSGYDLPAPSPGHISATLDVESEEERVEEHLVKTRVRSEEVWREVLKSSSGRDKAFVCHPSASSAHCSNAIHYPQKLIQYSMKLYLLSHAAFRAKQTALKALGLLEKSILRRLNSTVSVLSLAR